MRMNRPTLAAALATVILLSGCQKEEAQQGAAAFPPSAVAVFTTKTETLPITNELPGRIAATRVAEVRPRVSGIVVERVFQQGSKVNAGDVLYRIDPAPSASRSKRQRPRFGAPNPFASRPSRRPIARSS